MRSTLLEAIFFFCISFTSTAQGVIFSESVKDKSYDQYEIIGKVGNNYLVMLGNVKTKQRWMLVYDEHMKVKKEYLFNQVPEAAFNLKFITYANSLTIIYEYLKNDTTFYEAARLDSNLNPNPAQVILGFVVASRVPMRLEYSQDKSKILLCNLSYHDSLVFISTKIFDAQLQLLHTIFSPLIFNPVNEKLQYFRVANDGTVYFLILPAENLLWKRFSGFEVMYNNFKTTTYNSLLIQLNNKCISTEMKVEINNSTNKLLASSFYYSVNNTDSIAGLFTASADAQANKAASLLNPFPGNIVSQLNNKYLKINKYCDFEVKDIIPQNNGGLVITAEVVVRGRFGKAGSNWRNNVSPSPVMRDRDYGTGNYNNHAPYYTDYYLGGDFANNSSTDSPGKRDAGDKVYDDMIITYFNKSMTLDTSFVVSKKQAYRYFSPDKLSYLTLNNGREISLLFNTGRVTTNITYNKSFSANAELALKPALKTTDDHNVLIPLYSKQVSLNQALLVFSYRSKMRFGIFNF